MKKINYQLTPLYRCKKCKPQSQREDFPPFFLKMCLKQMNQFRVFCSILSAIKQQTIVIFLGLTLHENPDQGTPDYNGGGLNAASYCFKQSPGRSIDSKCSTASYPFSCPPGNCPGCMHRKCESRDHPSDLSHLFSFFQDSTCVLHRCCQERTVPGSDIKVPPSPQLSNYWS